MKRFIVLILAASIACSLAIPAAAAPWVKKATVNGRYAGKWVETECTYTNCDETPSRQRLNWRFTPTRRGVELYSLTGDYTMNLRWLPRGEYTGTADSGRRWKRLIEFTVTKQVQLGGVWTARKLVGHFRTWAQGAPRYHDDGRIILTLRQP